MIGRISSRTTAMNSLANLQAGQQRSDRLQQQLSSGKAYTKLSDDPVAANDALRFRSEISVNEQYGRNISDAQRWVATQESAMDAATGYLQEARTALVQAGSTGTLDPQGRRAIAEQLRRLRDDLITTANTPHEGRPVFAGTADVAAAVSTTAAADGSYALLGNGSAVNRRVASGQDVQVNATAVQVFGGPTALDPAAKTVFQQLDELATAVQDGNTAAISEGLSTIDAARDRLLSARSVVAARTVQLDALEQSTGARGDALEASLSEVEGVDIAKAMIEFRLQDTAYQAALASTAKVIQPTLLDFLR
ncbi:flagellar hook-associated protein FlgL [Kineococcus gypseus]|uniref:flagellar hook-associated protein FlgL n=1 Tax=Kineococcus gypseus TaxID=1637102 RepID=UPI003D7D9DAE